MEQESNKPAIRETFMGPVRLHSVLVRVFGAGILLIGESGIGKSECALDLITRGHRLVADDAVDVVASVDGLTGAAPASTADLLEIRGLGVINVRNTFGDDAVSQSSAIDVCVELRKEPDVERVGNFIHHQDISGRQIPKFIVPVTSGRNLAVLIETAARLFLRRHYGAAAGDNLLSEHTNLLEHIPAI